MFAGCVGGVGYYEVLVLPRVMEMECRKVSNTVEGDWDVVSSVGFRLSLDVCGVEVVV